MDGTTGRAPDAGSRVVHGCGSAPRVVITAGAPSDSRGRSVREGKDVRRRQGGDACGSEQRRGTTHCGGCERQLDGRRRRGGGARDAAAVVARAAGVVTARRSRHGRGGRSVGDLTRRHQATIGHPMRRRHHATVGHRVCRRCRSVRGRRDVMRRMHRALMRHRRLHRDDGEPGGEDSGDEAADAGVHGGG